MRVTFQKREELATGVWQYYFVPDRPIDFTPGQYVQLHLPDVVDDHRGTSRTFTLTSLPTEAAFSFIIKVPTPHSAYKECLHHLQPGAVGHIDDAMGDLVLPKVQSVPLVFIAGGIGIASYVSMIRSLLMRKEERAIYLFYGLQTKTERLYQSLLDSYPLALQQLSIAPNHLSVADIRASSPPDALFYISGSQRFVESMCTDLLATGLLRERIIYDYYEGYSEL